jgi:cyclopropane fatty-acyl-phospholipid synthase-like methyltransferase
MTEPTLNRELFEYYNERAQEYEDAYRGKFFMEVPDPTLYQHDTRSIQELLPDYVKGKCLDIACGTGFWLPVYQKNCSSITLIDQSAGVLAECKGKIDALGINSKTEVIQGDIFSHQYRQHAYNSVVAGFLMSHMVESELNKFLHIVKIALVPSGNFIIIDNIWDYARAQLRRSKAGMIKRYLKDGREFEIYKRYFDKKDLHDIAKTYDFSLEILYWGRVFFLAAGRLNNVQA